MKDYRFCEHCGKLTVSLINLSKHKLGNIIGKMLHMKPEGTNVMGEKYWGLGTLCNKKRLIKIINAIQELKEKQ